MATNQLSPDKFARDMFAVLKEYIESGDSVSVLVAGRTGVGKSSLINSLIGDAQLAAEGSSVRPVSREIISYTTSLNTPIPGKESEATLLTAWDSPGFGDIFISRENREERLSAMKAVVEKADVLLYCFNITDRITRDDISGIVEITKALDPSIWRKAVFPLTFANKLDIPESEKGKKGAKNLVQYLSYKVQEWKEIIYGVLKNEARVPENILNDISVVPVGYRNKCPPGQDDWYTPFWIELYKKTRERGKPGLLRLTWSRFDCQQDKVQDFNDRRFGDSLPVKLFNNNEVTNLINVGELEQYLPSSPQLSVNGAPISCSVVAIDSPQESVVAIDAPHESVVASEHDSHSPLQLPAPNSAETSLTMKADPERPDLPVRRAPLDREQELRTAAGAEATAPPMIPQGDDERVEHSRFMKAVKIGGVVGSTAAVGVLVGLLIGIVGGPIGLAIGASAGFFVGSSVGAGGLIAKELSKFMKKKRDKKKAQVLGPDNPSLN